MYQKDMIRSAWKSAGLYDENDSKLQQFLQQLDDPTQCWAEMIAECRRSYASYKSKLIGPLIATGDKLVRLSLIRAALPSAEDEMTMLKDYIGKSDPVREETELKAIALKNVAALNRSLKTKANLTPAVSALIAKRAATAK